MREQEGGEEGTGRRGNCCFCDKSELSLPIDFGIRIAYFYRKILNIPDGSENQ
jgi:hypothetical protein